MCHVFVILHLLRKKHPYVHSFVTREFVYILTVNAHFAYSEEES